MGRRHRKSLMPRQDEIANPNLPSRDQEAVRTLAVASERSVFSGPLPPPDLLAEYERLVPGTAAKIVDMAQKQGEHRMLLEKSVIGGDGKRSTMGMVFAFILSLALIGCGTACILHGHDVAGAAIIGTSMASLIGTFIYGSSSRRKERANKAQAQTDLAKRPDPNPGQEESGHNSRSKSPSADGRESSI